ncbi:MAG TPA: CHAP domain-containing protein [Candidatus Saccharimonadales bacterium]
MSQIKRVFVRTRLIAAALLMIVSVPLSIAPTAHADRFQDQIEALQREISSFNAAAQALRSRANTLQNAVNLIAAQKNAIQKKIDLSQAQYNKLVAEIQQTEKDIKANQAVLGATIADLYVDSSLSPLEMLASSNSIGDYVDKQEYRTAVKEQIQVAIKAIKALRKELEGKKVAVTKVLNKQKSERSALAAKEAERASLLARTRGQESAYRSLVSKRNSELEAVRAAQAAAYAEYNRRHGGSKAVPGDPGRGGYPDIWANAPQDSLVDDWGMYNRECVSYTAWRVYNDGKNMPNWGGRGHAYQWIENAKAERIPYTHGVPSVGSIAVWDTSDGMGGYGHVAYVERVNGDGSIWISQYNFPVNGVSGQYSEMSVSAAEVSQLDFINFR